MAHSGHWDSRIRQQLASNANQAKICEDHGLDQCIVPNPGNERVTESMMATALEAIIGAVHQDGGEEAVSRVLRRLGLVYQDPLVTFTVSLFENTHRGTTYVDTDRSRPCREGYWGRPCEPPIAPLRA
jgi:hypothetical protein